MQQRRDRWSRQQREREADQQLAQARYEPNPASKTPFLTRGAAYIELQAAQEPRTATGFQRARPEIEAAYGSPEASARLVGAAQALADGDYEAVLHALLDHNQYIMRVRNGSEAWARLDGERLDVRYRDETEGLPDRAALPLLWRSTYFIDALKSIINQIGA